MDYGRWSGEQQRREKRKVWEKGKDAANFYMVAGEGLTHMQHLSRELQAERGGALQEEVEAKGIACTKFLRWESAICVTEVGGGRGRAPIMQGI